MRSTYILLLSALTLFAISCTKSKNSTGDYIILGITGGYDGGADYYLIKDGQLKHDTLNTSPLLSTPYGISGLTFDVVMPDARYQKVAHLLHSIPTELLYCNNARTGYENSAHTRQLEVHTVINGISYNWYFLERRGISTAVDKFIMDCKRAFH